jgi:hypothetical protein
MLDLVPYAVAVVVFVSCLSFLHFRRKRILAAFETLARRHGGTIGQGPWGLYPTIALPLEDGGQVHVSGIRGSSNGRVTSTFAWIGRDDYPDLTFEARRKPERMGQLEGLGQVDANTGHSKFDEAFWMHVDDPKAAREFLDKELTYALLAFDPVLSVRLRVGTLLAFPDGWRTARMQPSLEVTVQRLPPELDDVERMLDLARLVHERLLRIRKAQAA